MRTLGPVDHFVAGAIGPPGGRAFYLEVGTPEGLEWYAVEKEQVAMLAAAAIDILDDLGSPGAEPGPSLEHPGEPAFRVGRIALGVVDDTIEVMVTPIEEEPAEPVSFTVGPGLLDAMARRAVEVVAAGRPPCRWCGLPVDPEGHVCPSSNGDLRS